MHANNTAVYLFYCDIVHIFQAYMFYGLYTQPLIIPESLYPSPLIKIDLPVLGRISDASSKTGPEIQDETTGMVCSYN